MATRRPRMMREALAMVLVATLPWAGQGHAAVVAQAGTAEILFTPGDAVDRRIITAIDAARDEVHVLAFTFTHPGIARALAAARARGVAVEIVVDRAQGMEAPGSAIAELRRRGVAIWLDSGPGSAHNKVMIIDPRLPGATTVTGSFNFTRAAQRANAENVIIFHRNRDVARIYERYYTTRRAGAQPWSGAAVPARAPRPPAAPLPPRAGAPEVERRVP